MQTVPARVKGPLVALVVVALTVFGAWSTADAQKVTSDEAAGYLVFPKVAVDLQGQFGPATDTVIQLTNTSATEQSVNCWYVNANSFCSNAVTTVCRTNADCPSAGTCDAAWQANDFQLVLTPQQPVAWVASDGAGFLPCDPVNPNVSQNCQSNNVGAVPPLGTPFRGELKCVQVDGSDAPIAANDLKGEATVYGVNPGAQIVDAAAYNAIGFQAGTPGAPDNVLCLGGPAADAGSTDCPTSEYAGCPSVLILNHTFEGAVSPMNANNTVNTELTLVPCTEDLRAGLTGQTSTTAQMLIYNEFEQRFSTSRQVRCFEDLALSDIDTRPGTADDAYSIFAVGNQGTLVGQTRIRGVETTEATAGHGLLAVAREIVAGQAVGIGSAAINVNYSGSRQQRDVVRLTVP